MYKEVLKATYKVGHVGADIKKVQEWLSYYKQPVLIDGEFGPATLAALQSVLGTAVTVVDQAVFDNLQMPIIAIESVVDEPMNWVNLSFSETVVKLAQGHLAHAPIEIGGPNAGPWVRYYMNGNEGEQWAWCAGFVTKILKQASFIRNVPMPIRGSFSCDELATQAKAASLFIPEGNKPKPGYVMLCRKSQYDWTHTGIVTEVYDDHYCSIEGNTNDSGSREGIAVCKMTRGYAKKDFIQVPA